MVCRVYEKNGNEQDTCNVYILILLFKDIRMYETNSGRNTEQKKIKE